MSKSKVFIFISISYALGILIASAFNVPNFWLNIFLAVCLLIFALSFGTKHSLLLRGGFFLFAVALGALTLQSSIVPNQYQNLFDSKQRLEGYIVEDVDVRPNQQLITFRPQGLKQNIQITTNLTQQFFYGDYIVVDGKIQEVKNFSEFDYQKYLERYNVYASMSFPKILVLKSHQLNPFKEFLLKIKSTFSHRLSQLLPEPQSSLLLGILLGEKSGLPKDVINNFNLTGTSHIIAVSGMNITIVVTALGSLVYVFGRRISFWLMLGGIVGFVVITGASASVIRAAIMGFLLLLALNIGRQYSITPALFFAGVIMLLINPKILFWDVGFQLSFVATLGIIYFLPLFKELTKNLPEFVGIKVLVLTTFSAIISTLPLILFNFGRLSLSAPLANVLVLPIIPFAMLFGFLAVLPLVGPGFAFLANGLLVYIIRLLGLLASVPYLSLNIQIPLWLFWVLFAGVFCIYFLLKFLVKKTSNHPKNSQPVSTY